VAGERRRHGGHGLRSPPVTLRVGFLGAGLIATYHSKSLHVSGADVTWAGVYDPDPERASQFAMASGATAYGSEEEVLDSCDVVYVCAWTAEHRRLVAAAADRGLAVFCEKPLGVDLAAAAEMVAAVEGAGVVNQVGLVLRHSPAFGMLKALAEDPSSGRPMCVVFRDDQYIPIQGGYASTWRGDVTKAGAGTLLEHSIHDLDMLEHVLGPVVSVSAAIAGFHQIDGIEDVASVLLRFANGATGTLQSVWHDVLERPSLRRVELFCERAYAVLEGDWFGPVEWLSSGSSPARAEGTELIEEAGRRGAALGNPDELFIEAVVRGEPAWPSFADALRAHTLADAVYQSAADGGAPVTVS
jgi:myo-inositol 2-dehydrogenase / D-chiro-inositol 1-dehydrogenase